jgi:chromosomal replication initiator protein
LIVGEDVCRYVVSRFATHARQLSGALNRLLAAQLTTGMPITLELAHDALADLAAANVRNVKLEDVERVVLEIFGLESNALKSSSRAKRCADPRAVAMWLARKHTRFTLAEIGQYFGGRKHSAVLAAQKKVDGWISTNETLDAGSTAFSINDVIERAERALTYPR